MLVHTPAHKSTCSKESPNCPHIKWVRPSKARNEPGKLELRFQRFALIIKTASSTQSPAETLNLLLERSLGEMSEDFASSANAVDSDQAEDIVDMFYVDAEEEYLLNSEREDVAFYDLYDDSHSSRNTPLVDTLELCNREGDEEVEEIDEKGMEEGTEVTSESSPGQRGLDEEKES